MKTELEIKKEIEFQRWQFLKHNGLAKNTSDALKQMNHFEVASRHAARKQALEWVLESPSTAIEESRFVPYKNEGE